MTENNNMEQIELQAKKIEEKINEGIDKTIDTTAENLEKTADKLQKTAEFIKNKNANTLKEDFTCLVNKHPGKMLAIFISIGFVAGKLLSK